MARTVRKTRLNTSAWNCLNGAITRPTTCWIRGVARRRWQMWIVVFLIRNSLPVPDNRLLRFTKIILRATVHQYPTGSLLLVWVNVWVTGTGWGTRKKMRWPRRNNRLISIRESYLKLPMDLRNALFMIRFPVKRSNGRAWMVRLLLSLHSMA